MKSVRELKPLFKWSGGKSREIIRVKPHLPQEFDTYYEPFLGGGAVWFHLSHPKNIVGDSYPELINFFNTIKSYRDCFLNKINDLSTSYNLEVSECSTKEGQQKVGDKYYYHFRDNDFHSDFDNAVKFYMLRQLSFSGMLRFSKNGRFNIPYGWYKNLKNIEGNQNREDIYSLLDNSKILNQPWQETVKSATEKDFVFLDPPYTRKFQKYHPNGNFGQEEHRELAEWFSQKKSKSLIILNKDDFTESLYKDFIIEEYGKRYSIQYRDRMKEEDSNTVHFIAKNY